MNQGPLASRPRVAYGGGNERRGKRIGGVGRAINGVPTGMGANYRPGTPPPPEPAPQGTPVGQREANVQAAKANGTFDGIRDSFNKGGHGKVMDEKGNITERPQTTSSGGGGSASSSATVLINKGILGLGERVRKAAAKFNAPNPTQPQATGAVPGKPANGLTPPPEARAKGGPVRKGKPYLVGEKGPELVVPTEDGMVIPNEVIEPKGKGGKRVRAQREKDGKKADVKDKAAWFAREARRWKTEGRSA